MIREPNATWRVRTGSHVANAGEFLADVRVFAIPGPDGFVMVYGDGFRADVEAETVTFDEGPGEARNPLLDVAEFGAVPYENAVIDPETW